MAAVLAYLPPLTCPILLTERVVNADLLQTERSVAARIGVRSDEVGFVLPDEVALLDGSY